MNTPASHRIVDPKTGGKVAKATNKGKSKETKRSSKKSNKQPTDDMAAAVETMASEAGEIDKIRNILFGTQMADYDHRFAQLEERIISQVAALGDKTAKRLKEIESLIIKQGEAFTRRLDSEQSERNQGAEALTGEIHEAREELSAAIDSLATQQAQELNAVDKQLTEMSSELSDEIHIQQVEAAKNLDQAVQQLDDGKLAREALSQMLLEMAGRLTESPE